MQLQTGLPAPVGPPAELQGPARQGRGRLLLLAGLGAFASAWAVVVAVAAHLHPWPGLHQLALLGHVVALVFGFGAVGLVDLYGVLWMLGRRTLADVTRLWSVAHLVVWVSLAALMASGLFLEPDPSKPLTRLKLVLVLVIGLNGIVSRRVLAGWRWLPPGTTVATAPSRHLRGMLISAAVSQVAWWGALLIGFYNSNR